MGPDRHDLDPEPDPVRERLARKMAETDGHHNWDRDLPGWGKQDRIRYRTYAMVAVAALPQQDSLNTPENVMRLTRDSAWPDGETILTRREAEMVLTAIDKWKD